MKRISFAWTTPAIKAKEKTCTRRNWSDNYAKRFNKGDVLMAVESNYRASNICQIRLTQKPVKEYTDTMPISDWKAEGFEYLEKIGAKVNGLTPRDLWSNWLVAPQKMWVVRFEYLNTPIITGDFKEDRDGNRRQSRHQYQVLYNRNTKRTRTQAETINTTLALL